MKEYSSNDSQLGLHTSGISLQEPLILNSVEFEQQTIINEPFQTKIIGFSMRKTKIRWVALFLAALLMFGNNYSFDNPQALQKPIMENLDISSPTYNLLYSVFSFPNIFLTLAGGFMIDLLGVRFGIVLFSTVVLLSQLIVAIGGTEKLFWMMLMGRSFFGIASENLIISQSAIVAKWFKGSELSLAIGIIMTVPEIGSALNSFLTPLIYEETQTLMWPLIVSVMICGVSVICAVALAFLDKKADTQQTAINLYEEEEDTHHVEEKVSFKDIKEFTATFWILLLVCTLTLGIYVPFLDDANDFYQEKFKFGPIEAGRLLMIPYLTSAITSPFIGTYVDRVGKRRLFICLTCFLFTVSCFLFGILEEGEEYENDEQIIYEPDMFSIFPLFLLGICYALYSCVIIPSVQYIVPQRVMGTAFGLKGSLESVALATFPLIAASIVTQNKSEKETAGYNRVGFFYAGMSSIGLILASSLYIFDKRGSIILDFVNPSNPTEQEALLIKRYRRDSEVSSDDEQEDNISQISDNYSQALNEDEEINGQQMQSKLQSGDTLFELETKDYDLKKQKSNPNEQDFYPKNLKKQISEDSSKSEINSTKRDQILGI